MLLCGHFESIIIRYTTTFLCTHEAYKGLLYFRICQYYRVPSFFYDLNYLPPFPICNERYWPHALYCINEKNNDIVCITCIIWPIWKYCNSLYHNIFIYTWSVWRCVIFSYLSILPCVVILRWFDLASAVSDMQWAILATCALFYQWEE